MIVACPSCEKKFRLDDEKLKSSNVKLKCTGCSTVFEVRAPVTTSSFQVRLFDGTEFTGLSLDEVRAKIADGVIGPDDFVAATGEPLAPASEHPDLAGIQFVKSDDDLFGENTQDDSLDDDLFGGNTSDEDDLFGASDDPIASNNDTDDDLFGGSGNDDDLFGDPASNDDDLFGESTPPAPAPAPKEALPDDDLFADSDADDDLFDESSADEDDLFGDANDDEDLFSSSSSTTTSQDSDDLFEENTDDDLFGDAEEEDLFSSSSSSSTTPPSKGASETNAAFDGEESDLFDMGSSDDDNGTNLFDDDITDDSPTGADDFFAEETNVQYDEDIEKHLDDNPLDFEDTNPDLGDAFALTEESVEDLVTMPFDLPTEKASKKGLIIGAVGLLTIGLAVLAVIFAPSILIKIPVVDSGIYGIHESMQSGWYYEKKKDELELEIQQFGGKYDVVSARKAIATAARNKAIINRFQVLEDKLIVNFVVAWSSTLLRANQFVEYANFKGSLGALGSLISKGTTNTPATGRFTIILEAMQKWRNDKIDGAIELLTKTEQYDNEQKFVNYIVLAELYKDLGNTTNAIQAYEKALDLSPENAYITVAIAELFWQKLKKLEQAVRQLEPIRESTTMDSLTQAKMLIIFAQQKLSDGDISGALENASKANEANSDNPDAAALKAELLNKSGDSIKALLLLDEYLENFPEHYELRLQHAIAQQAMGRVDDAVASYTTATGLNEARPEAQLLLSKLYIEQGDNVNGLTIAEKLELQFRDSSRVNRDLGEIYLLQGLTSKAKTVLDLANEQKPNDPATLALIGQYYRAKNQLTKAEQYLSKARDASGGKPQILEALGQVYLDRAQYQKAFDIYQSLLETQPQNPDILLALAKIRYYQKNYKQAEEFLQEALKFRLSLHEGDYYLSLLYYDTGNLPKAIAHVKQAISVNPVLKYRLQLGRAYEKDSKPGVAIKEYEAILEDFPDEKVALWRAVELNHATRRSKRAIVHLTKLLEITPKDPKVYSYLSRIHLDEGKTNDAASYLQKGLRQSPNSVDLLNIAGDLALRNTDYQKAKKYLFRARSIDSRNAKTRMLLGFYYKSGMNNPDKAQIEFQRAIKFGLNEQDKLVIEGELDALKYR